MATDLLIRNARVYTVEPSQPWAEAVAVRGERIAWLGDDADAAEHIGPATQVIDAEGSLLLPGIIDSHNHVRLGSDANTVKLGGADTLDEIRKRIREHLTAHPDADWIEAEGFHYAAIPGRMPRADDLEAVAGDRPIAMITYDAHNMVLNREAMRRFGITSSTNMTA